MTRIAPLERLALHNGASDFAVLFRVMFQQWEGSGVVRQDCRRTEHRADKSDQACSSPNLEHTLPLYINSISF